MESACPYDPTKRVEETHLLVLIPSKVNGVPLSLNRLCELVKKPKEFGHPSEINISEYLLQSIGDKTIESSYWALVTIDVIQGSKKQSFSKQCALLKNLYKVPRVLEMSVCLMMHHASSAQRLFTKEQSTWTRTEKELGFPRVSIGFFGSSGLSTNILSIDEFSYRDLGLAGILRF